MKNLRSKKKAVPLQHSNQERAFSSAGSERLPYKQRVGGSNPSTPTNRRSTRMSVSFFYVKNRIYEEYVLSFWHDDCHCGMLGDAGCGSRI